MIKARIPGIVSLINKSIEELESELSHLGRAVAVDAGVRISVHCRLKALILCCVTWFLHFPPLLQAQLYTILELCRAFDRVFKEHLEGG